MRHAALLFTLSLCAALPARADSSDKQLLSPSEIQEQQRAAQVEQRRIEQEAGGQSLAEKRSVLIHDCQARVGRKSLYPGPVSFDSVNIIEEKRIYITGTARFPDSKGVASPWHYECVLDAGKKTVESVSVKPAG